MPNLTSCLSKISRLIAATLSLYLPIGNAADIDVSESGGAEVSNSADTHLSLLDNNYINKTDGTVILSINEQGEIVTNRVTATVQGESNALVASVNNGALKLSNSTLTAASGNNAVTLSNGKLSLNEQSKIVSTKPNADKQAGDGIHFSGRNNQIDLNNSTVEGDSGLVASAGGQANINLSNGAKIIANGSEGRAVIFEGGSVNLSGNNTALSANRYGVYESAAIGSNTNTTVNVTNGAKITVADGIGVALNNRGQVNVQGQHSVIAGNSGITANSTVTVNVNGGAKVTGTTGAGIDLAKGGSVTVQDSNSEVSGSTGIRSAADAELTLNVSNAGQVKGATGAGVELGRGTVKVTGSDSGISGTTGIQAADNATINISSGAKVTGSTGAGIDLAKGGSVTIQDSNSEVSGNTGIRSAADAELTLNVSNAGQVKGAKGAGVELGRGTVKVTGSDSGISGTTGIQAADNATINISSGAKVTGSTGAGIDLAKGGSVTIQDSNSEVSGSTGIRSAADAELTLNVSNAGQVKGATGAGVELGRGTVKVTGSDSGISGTTGVQAADNATINISSGAKVTGSTGAGIDLTKGGSVTIQDSNSEVSGNTGIRSAADAELTLNVSNAGQVKGATGAGVELGRGTVKVTGSDSGISGTTGVQAADNATINISSGAKVTGSTGAGIDLTKGGSVTIQDSNSEVSGNTGIRSAADAELTLNVSNAGQVKGAKGAGVELGRGTVKVTGSDSGISGTTGVQAADNATINISSGAKVTGSTGAGIDLAKGGTILLSDKDSRVIGNEGIKSSGTGALDLSVLAGATVSGTQYGLNFQSGQVIVDGAGSTIQGEQSAIVVGKGNSQINIQQGAKVISNGEALTIQNSDKTLINVTGKGSELRGKVALKLLQSKETILNLGAGALISTQQGSAIETDNKGDINLTINAQGESINTQQAHGINLTGQGLGNNNFVLNELTLNTTGSNFSALRVDRGSDSTNQVSLKNSRLQSARNSTIALQQGHLSLNLDNSTVQSDNIAFEVAKESKNSQAKLKLTQNSKLLGDLVNHSASSIVDVSLEQRSSLKGATREIGQLTISDATSQWYVRANSSLRELINNGRIYFREAINNMKASATPDPFKSVTVHEDYKANNGWLEINTVLAGENSPTDKLMVGRDTAGTTFVKINNIGGNGGRVVNGIEIVKVAGKSEGIFVQDKRYLAGGYEYTLYKGRLNESNNGNWYLYSTAHPYIGAYLGNRSAAIEMFNSPLAERLTQIHPIKGASANQLSPAVWAYASGARSESYAAERDLKIRTNFKTLQLGADLVQWSNNDNINWTAGLMLGYGTGHNKVDNQRHYNNRNIMQATAKVDGYNVGLYSRWEQDVTQKNTLSIDAWLEYSWFKNNINSYGAEQANYRSQRYNVATEIGYGVTVNKNGKRSWILKPQLQARLYSYRAHNLETNLGNNSLLTSANVNGIATVAGVHFSGKTAALRGIEPFIELNWHYNSAAHKAIKVGNNPFTQQLPKNLYELNTGLNIKLAPSLQTWFKIGGKIANKKSDYSEFNGGIGLKYNW